MRFEQDKARGKQYILLYAVNKVVCDNYHLMLAYCQDSECYGKHLLVCDLVFKMACECYFILFSLSLGNSGPF